MPIGPTFEFPVPLTPTQSSGPFFDHVVESPSSSSGSFFDHVIDTIPTMSLGPMFDHAVSFDEGGVGPVYNMPVTNVRERAISLNLALILNEYRDRSAGTNYSYQIGDFFEGLIRNKQITERDIDADRLVDTPVQILAARYGVDMTTSNIFSIYTAPSGKIIILLGILVETTAANTVTAAPSLSVGITSGETDIFDTEALVDLNAVGETWSNWLVFSHSRAATPGEDIKVNLTGATAATLTADIHLIGFEV
jgi:hypothetical protein